MVAWPSVIVADFNKREFASTPVLARHAYALLGDGMNSFCTLPPKILVFERHGPSSQPSVWERDGVPSPAPRSVINARRTVDP